MTVRLSTKLRNLMLSSNGFSGAFTNGVMYIYSGTQPASADSAVTGTLLGIVTDNAGAFTFGVATNGLHFDAAATGTVSKAAAQTWKFNGIATGTAGWARLMGNATDSLGDDSGSNLLPRMDMSIGVSGADLNMSNINVVSGAPNTIDVFQFSLPAQ